MLRALTRLSPGDRELMLLSVWDGLPARDIAVVLGVNAVATRTRLSRARRRLERALRAELESHDAASLPAAAKDRRMNATELLAELRPPLEDTPGDAATLERILLAGPEPPRRRRRRLARPLAVAGVTAIAATAAFALVPSGSSGPVGLAGAAAALTEPDVLLHFKVTTTHLPSRDVERAETWQTPDGRRSHTRYNGIEVSYDQRARKYEVYLPKRDEVLIHRSAGDLQGQARPVGLARELEPELRRRPAGAPPEGAARGRPGGAPRRPHDDPRDRRRPHPHRTRSSRSPTRPPAPRSRSYAKRR